MRDALMVFHRWAALIASIFVLILAVTGSALVFEGAMDRASNPNLWYVRGTGPRLPLDMIVARVRARSPKAPVTSIGFSTVGNTAIVLQAGGEQIFVDPYTGAVKGARTPAEFSKSLPRRLHVLHVSLTGGSAGKMVVGLATILSLLLVTTGIVLWWPDKLWRVRWSASWKRIAFDLHHQAGIIAAVILLVITTSGLFIHYESLNALLGRLDSQPPPVTPVQPKPASPAAGQITADSLFRVGVTALPGARVTSLSMPAKRDQPFLVNMGFPEDRTPGGRSRVFVDRFTGAVVQLRNTRTSELGTRVANNVRSIHTGDLGGKPTEAIWLLASIVLASQTVTGFLMWWNGRKGRAAAARRSTA